MGSFSTPEAYFIGLGCEVSLHGMPLVLFKKKKSRVITVMTLMNFLMYTVGTAHMIINFRQNFAAFLWHNGANDESVFHNTSSATQWSQLLLEVVNIALGDSIVIWRAWILWNRRRWIILSSVLLLLGTVGSGSGLVYAVATAPVGVVFTDPSLQAWAIAFILSTLSTNGWATILVAYRTWLHFKLVRHLTGVSILGSFRKQNTISQLTAIYPTLIITLVCTHTQTQQQSWTRRPAALAQLSVEDFTATASSEPSIPMRPVKIGLRRTLNGAECPPHLKGTSSESVVAVLTTQ
ncbi:hypothetical protein F5146DRAFT_1073870 [Armillaria mellea]|nr:hypothetical protein F5146DRAFT_1073870 [Armillaria mellea]